MHVYATLLTHDDSDSMVAAVRAHDEREYKPAQWVWRV